MASLKVQPGITKAAPAPLKQTAGPSVDPRAARITQLFTEAKAITDGPGPISTKVAQLGAKFDEVQELKAVLRGELPKDQQPAALKADIALLNARSATLKKNDPAQGPITRALLAQNDAQLLVLEGELRALTTPKPKGDAVDAKQVAAPTGAQVNVAQVKATNEAQSFAALQSRNAGGLFGFSDDPSIKSK